MGSREITTQRAYDIPKGRLDQFLTALEVNWSDHSHFEAQWIFDEDDDAYKVVVNQYENKSVWALNSIDEFVAQLWGNHREKMD